MNKDNIMSNVTKIDGTPLKAVVPTLPKASMTLEEALQADAPYFDDLMDGRVGELQLALYDMDMDKEANMIEQILWKLVNATITEQYRST
jgi:hypothetical protein